ncbi:MAG: uncharacterized SAM-binding protein YcdF (DUF218 family) [Arcobacteraceae bacterium]|jgi:uncharacterized SAM-binding protein YcdF (DUF218 family)
MDFAFILKKIISGSIMPLSITLIFLFISLLLLDKRTLKQAQFFILTPFLIILFISYQPVANLFLEPLESGYTKLESIPKDVRHILLLGGDVQNRGWEVLRLYNKIRNAKIITSGYEGDQEIPEAISSAHLFYELGIPKEDIIVHPKPKDTEEEVLNIKAFLGDLPFILVTSAYHMPRAMRLFKKEGLSPIPAPTDFKIKNYNFASIAKGQNIKKTEIALHEYLGLLWAKIKGQI